jgi:hypothetical protein
MARAKYVPQTDPAVQLTMSKSEAQALRNVLGMTDTYTLRAAGVESLYDAIIDVTDSASLDSTHEIREIHT